MSDVSSNIIKYLHDTCYSTLQTNKADHLNHIIPYIPDHKAIYFKYLHLKNKNIIILVIMTFLD